jgi:hypothetical protein
MGRTRRVLGTALLSTALQLGTAACSSFADDSSKAATTTSSHKATQTTSSSATSSSSTTSSSSSTSSSPGGPLGTDAAGRKLTLADFFQPSSSWVEKRYDLADRNNVQGIGTTVNSCYQTQPQVLELRLGNKFKQLTFSAAQANDSNASDQKLVVEVLANNQQAEIQSVPFNQVQDFTIKVDGVNALKIMLYLDNTVEHCGNGSVVGVITDTTVN